MSVIESIILGIIQGITEFLPVSSSGHLEIVKTLMRQEVVGHQNMFFTVVVHFATAMATIVVFRKDIKELIVGVSKLSDNNQVRYILKIIISMIPATIVGIFLEDWIAQLFLRNMLLVGLSLVATAILLYFSDKVKDTYKSKMTYKSAFWIGVAQMIAILPGVSRSGATICTAVLLGFDRQTTAKFSFLMVIPLIFGSMFKSLLTEPLLFEPSQSISLVLGFIAAFFSGVLICKWMIQLVRNSKLIYFSIYCLAVGVVAIIFS